MEPPPLPTPSSDTAPPLPPDDEPAHRAVSASVPSTEAPPLPPTAAESSPAPPLAETDAPSAPPPSPEEEEDPLIVAAREREEAERALAEAADIKEDDDPALKVGVVRMGAPKDYNVYDIVVEFCMLLRPFSLSHFFLQYFYSEMRGVDQENEVNRILGAFKLNPYEQLGLRFDCDSSAIRRQYRRSSLMVHPDKCPHPRAKDAFEILGTALKHLEDPERKANLDNALNFAKEDLLKDWRKATKHDAGVRLAASLDARGMEGVEAAHAVTPAFADAWKARSREVLGRAEWRRQRMSKRIKEEEERGREEHRLEKQLNKNIAEHEKAWEKGRTERVGTWRDFVAKKAKKSKGGPVGGIKPPKVRETDDDRRYIQRVTTEEFRPGKK